MTYDALTELVLTLFRAHQSVSSAGDRLVAPWGLSSAKWKVLGALALSPVPLSAAGIGRAMGLSRQAALKQAEQLLAMGLLERFLNPQDARAPLYRLSATGTRRYREVTEAWLAMTGSLAQGYSDAELLRIRDVLNVLAERSEHAVPSSMADRGGA